MFQSTDTTAMKLNVDPPGNTDILFVDDDPIIRSLYEKVLVREGYRVFTAADGRTGLKVLERAPVPMLITDIFMEEMDGIELITRIHKRFPQMKIIAISGGGAYRASECLRLATALGADESLAKPFRADELIHAVGKWLPRHPLRDS